MNYNLINKEDFPSLGLKVFLYEHNKTKARLIYVDSNDNNKTFALAFKTPPTNSKGMAHIMEHSVLNGSKKYRTKDPFMDMASSSLQTFLNAMTYPDKTVFPVSSENDKDFRNLVDVYTDAVFAPLVLEKKEIFNQEGWHYDLDENDKIVGISGVVYNEMKGALTDPESLIANDIDALLYKNSPYEYESGGSPEEIYKLNYEEFVDFYKKHYHPSNCIIYFYGKIDDIEGYMDRLDKEYLSHYEENSDKHEIKVSENSYKEIMEGPYPASKIEENSDYLTYAMLSHSNLDKKESLTASIIVSTLFNMDSSKIRLTIQEELSPEYFYARSSYGNRSSLIIQAQKTDKKKVSRFVEIIEDGLKEASHGLNKESLKSAFALFDFAQRENLNSVNAGLNYFLSMSFDADPFDSFRLITYTKELESLMDTDYFENFIKKYYLNNPSKLIHIASPSLDYNKKKEDSLKIYLKKINENISESKLKEIKEDLEKLKTYQDKENTKEEKETIPRLDIEDVPAKTVAIPRLIENDSFEYVFHELPTAGLIYTDLYFNINHLDLEELKYAQVIADLLGSIDTENMKYTEIDDIIWQKLAGLNFTITNFRPSEDEINRNFKISFKTIDAYIPAAIEIIKEFMEKSIFIDKARMLELFRIRKSIFESRMYDIGHMIAINRNNSHIDKLAFIQENLSGLEYFNFIKKSIKLIEDDFEKFAATIKDIYAKIFTKNLSINISGDISSYEKIKACLNDSFRELDDFKEEKRIDFKPKPLREAIATDANVNYVSKSYRLAAFEKEYSGKYMLAASILSNPYLYKLIRAKGGAYGAGMIISRNMNLATYSYRDPKIKETLEAYDQIPEITENLEMSNRDFENQQISAAGSILRPKTPNQMGESDYSSIKNASKKTDDQILEEIKSTKIEDIRKLAPTFRQVLAKNNICVFGNRKDIEACKENFDVIIDLND